MDATTPTIAEVQTYDGLAAFAVLKQSVQADTLTPIVAYQRLVDDGSEAFLLESAESGRTFGRWSFIGLSVREKLVMRDHRCTRTTGDGRSEVRTFEDPLEVVAERLAAHTVWSPVRLPPFHGGAVGYVGFDCVRYFEPVPLALGAGLGLPEAVLLLADGVAAFDHLHHRIELMMHVPLSGDRQAAWLAGERRLSEWARRLTSPTRPEVTVDHGELGPAQANRSPDDMRGAVARAREAIEQGEVFQVVVSERLSVACTVDPLAAYRSLRALNPSPYMFLLRLGDFALVGASPEVLVRVRDGELLLRPIAGTRPRGSTELEDVALGSELLADEKECAEHRMLVDLGRNDAGRVAKIGSVAVVESMRIERYSHVMHMVSDVTATLADGCTMFDAFRSGFPAGTVSGAPKIRACELLASLEPDRRGPYAGAVGWFGCNGNMDTAIAIRTLVIEPEAVHVQAGAGVVWDSVPQSEHLECLHKARGPLVAVQSAARGRR